MARLFISCETETRNVSIANAIYFLARFSVLLKTQDYLDIFARFKQKENIEAVERILTAHDDLEPFERAQLGRDSALRLPHMVCLVEVGLTAFVGSLCCESAEEAKTLIPSLVNKKSDEELQELLDEISKLRNYIE